MDTNELTKVLDATRADVQSIRATTSKLLHALREPRVAAPDSLLTHYCHRIVTILLNWLGQGERELLTGAAESFWDELSNSAEVRHALAGLAPDVRVLLRLQIWSELIGVYLRTDNLASYLGQLAGNRRKRWREALCAIDVLARPVTCGEFVPKLFESKQAASEALNRMVEQGLLEKRQVGAQRVVYDLTWPGRAVCLALRRFDDGSYPPPPQPPAAIQEPPNCGIRNRQIDNETGLYREELIRAAEQASIREQVLA